MRKAPCRRSVVVTGLGVVTPIGVGIQSFWQNAVKGHSGVRSISLPELSDLPWSCRIGGEVTDFTPNDWMGGMQGRMAARFTQFAVAATKMALTNSTLDLGHVSPHRIKVAFGSAVNGLSTFSDEIRPWLMPEFSGHAATSHITAETGALGQPTSFSTACCAGLDAIGWAAEQVSRGYADVLIASASDAPFSRHVLLAFHASGTLSTWGGPPHAASRPFDAHRCGLILGEGAATVILEDETAARARGAKCYARVLGFGSASEGGGLRTVEASGHAAARAMSMALDKANLLPEEVDYVCAHGNSMINYDAAETAALKLLLGRHATNVPVSSIKSMCGHALGAAGAIQTVATCLVLEHSTIFPTINYEYSDPDCDLDYVPNNARRARVRTALVHAHSIGGTHLALVLGSPS